MSSNEQRRAARIAVPDAQPASHAGLGIELWISTERRHRTHTRRTKVAAISAQNALRVQTLVQVQLHLRDRRNRRSFDPRQRTGFARIQAHHRLAPATRVASELEMRRGLGSAVFGSERQNSAVRTGLEAGRATACCFARGLEVAGALKGTRRPNWWRWRCLSTAVLPQDSRRSKSKELAS